MGFKKIVHSKPGNMKRAPHDDIDDTLEPHAKKQKASSSVIVVNEDGSGGDEDGSGGDDLYV